MQVASLAAVAIKKRNEMSRLRVEWMYRTYRIKLCKDGLLCHTEPGDDSHTATYRNTGERRLRCESQRADKVSATVGLTRPRGDARSFSARITNRVLTLLAAS